jgi:hypothetical protein
MMYGYPSIGQAMGGAAPAAASACRCAQRCFCPPGRPCRCSGGCSCRHSQAVSRAAAWVDANEGELARRRSALRSRAYGLMQRRSAMQDDWNRRSRLNGMFARRFNWGPHLPRIARAIGSYNPRPDSNRFLFSLARWQGRNGLPANGLLTPNVWRALLAAIRQRPRPPMPAPWPAPWPAGWPAPWPAPWPGTAQAAWPPAAPTSPPWPGSGQPGAAGAPYAPPFDAATAAPGTDGSLPGMDAPAGMDGTAPDAGPGMQAQGDAGEPAAPPSEEMWPGYGLGFRARHPVPY